MGTRKTIMDDGFKKFIRHTMSMRQMTSVELVNTYWQQAHQIAKTGRLGFIIRGNLSWESEQPCGITGSNDIWLKPNIYNLFKEGRVIGRESFYESILYYTQRYWNIYETWGTLAIKIDPNDASASKPLIEQALEKLTCVSNTMSFLCGASLRWFPARYAWVRHEPMPPPLERAITESWDCIPLPRSQDESTLVIINDEYVTNQLFPLVDRIEAMPSDVQTVIKIAIDWHAQANRYASGLNRFVNYWESIELLGNFFYQKLPADVVGRKSKGEKKDEIMVLLQGDRPLTRRNCMDIVGKCKEICEPTARAKITSFLSCVTDKRIDLRRIENTLFHRDVEAGRSLKEIRDDIAHGKISEHAFEKVAALGHRLVDAQRISEEVILRSIMGAEKLAQQLRKKDGG